MNKFNRSARILYGRKPVVVVRRSADGWYRRGPALVNLWRRGQGRR